MRSRRETCTLLIQARRTGTNGLMQLRVVAIGGTGVKIINDAAMQALGSYRGGTMFFLGLGTALGSALVAEGQLVPMQLAHLSFQ
jgi:hypothetical protein